MPFIRKTRKRRFRKRRTRRPKVTGPGTSLRRKLRYAEEPKSLTVTNVAPAVIRYTCNGLFDPLVAIGGHQPRFFDQYMTMYDHYVALSSKLRVWLQTDATQGVIFGITILDSAVTGISLIDYLENPHTVYSVTDGSAPGPKHLSMSASMRKFLGRKVMGDNQLKGSAAANPAEQAYFHCWVSPIDPSEASSESFLQITVDYDTVFIEPKLPSIS